MRSCSPCLFVFTLLLPFMDGSVAHARGSKGKSVKDTEAIDSPQLTILLGPPRGDRRLGLARGLESIWPGKPFDDIHLPDPFSRYDMHTAHHPSLQYEAIMPPLKFAKDKLDPDRIGLVQVAIEQQDGALSTYFGKGRTAKAGGFPSAIWVDANQRIRAKATNVLLGTAQSPAPMTLVQFEPYLPTEAIFAEFFNAPGTNGELELGPQLAAGLEAAQRSGKGKSANSEDTPAIDLPNSEFAWVGSAWVKYQNQHIDSITYEFNTTADPEGVPLFLKKLCAFLPKDQSTCVVKTILKKREMRIHQGDFGPIRVFLGDGTLQITRGAGER